jgi:pyruvate formate lyase activating enzyme
MKGTIFNIKRFAIHDGPGIRTTVFLKGCPMRCTWCHNPESWLAYPQEVARKVTLDGVEFCELEQIGKEYTIAELMNEMEKERMVMEESHGGVTFSGGEPLQQPQFLKDALIACKNAGFHTAVDTSGYDEHKGLESIIPYTDLFLFDLKLMDDFFHQHFTGVSNRPVIASLKLLAQHNCKIQIRVPLINGITASMENILAIAETIESIREQVVAIDLLPFHRIGKSKYLRLALPYSMEGAHYAPDQRQLEDIAAIFRERGYKVSTTKGDVP